MSTAEAPATTRTFFGHPAGLSTLFFTEFWERFSYYGMRALLVLYLVAPPDGATPPGAGLGMSTATASAIYGTYVALVYLLPLLGGLIADRGGDSDGRCSSAASSSPAATTPWRYPMN
ncbi:MAG: hypothetical protein V9E82_16115 [Candidatus Nanopelagicales bacterium]